MSKKIFLFSLQTFSATGGIQKMTRTVAYCLNNIAGKNGWNFKLWSLYDRKSDLMSQYLPSDNFKAFGNQRLPFLLTASLEAVSTDIIILSHINLSIVGIIYKFLNPKCQIWLIAHGIEVWRPLNRKKRRLLSLCEKIICVSSFTKQKVVELHKVDPQKCLVINNAVDPFIKLPNKFFKPVHLVKKYDLHPDNKIIFTLTRLASTEQYKGHDQVIKVISSLKHRFPTIKYILAGQYDAKEEIRIQKMLSEYNVSEQVILTGFIPEEELADHFLLADLFVLPSRKEGFGIVFIEALACGLPVICGNEDGSVDAIKNGELGKAVNVADLEGLEKAITDHFNNPLDEAGRRQLQKACLDNFNYKKYTESLLNLFNNEI